MTQLDEFGKITAVFLAFLLSFAFQGADCDLVVSPAGSTLVNAEAGSNVTLAVTFGGAPDPVVTWFMGTLPVVTWTINSTSPPAIAEDRGKVLRIEPNGSLTFVNVTLEYTSNYTVEMTKSGLGKSSTNFTLEVFENIHGDSGGLSGPAIAGIAAGIPCGLLLLVLLVCCRIRCRLTITKIDEVGFFDPFFSPDPLFFSQTLPTFVPPPPVRVATTV